MKVSQACVDLVKAMEGCRLTAYLDTLAEPDVWTIGYGHTGPDVYEGRTMTQREADDTLLDRLNNEYAPGVERALAGVATTQAQFDAFVSFAYNVGVGGFAGSSVLRQHKAGNYQAAADAFRMWNKAGGTIWPGLVRRREAERALYLSQTAEPTKPAKPIKPPRAVESAIKAFNKAAVRLQTRLKEEGFYDGELDADFGKGSRDALLAYLRQYHPK